MSERVTPGPVCGDSPIREAVCVHTKKVYDACRSKECIQDLRVYLTRGSQELLERSSSVKPRRAELLWVDVNVQPIDFNRGFYNVDARFFYKIIAEVGAGCGRMQDICGLAYYDKRAVLYGSEGAARIFSSQSGAPDPQTIEQTNKPTAVVETCAVVIAAEERHPWRHKPVFHRHTLISGRKKAVPDRTTNAGIFYHLPTWAGTAAFHGRSTGSLLHRSRSVHR